MVAWDSAVGVRIESVKLTYLLLLFNILGVEVGLKHTLERFGGLAVFLNFQ